MSPAAQNIAEIDQYFEHCLVARAPKTNYQRQNTRQFHNSQARSINNFQCDPFGKPSYNNGSRSPKFNPGFPRPVNFVDLHAQNGWTNIQPVSPLYNQRRYQQYNVNSQFMPKPRNNNNETRQPFTRMPGNCQNPQVPQTGVKFNNNTRNKMNFHKNNQKVYKHVDKLESQQNQKESAGRASDVASNASDESSGQSENSLPRIIKPRKRRKKDRKPVESSETVEAPPVVDNGGNANLVNKSQLKSVSNTSYTSCEQPPNITIQPRGNLSVTQAPPMQVLPKLDNPAKDDTIAFSPLIADSFVNLILDEDQSGRTPAALDKLVVTKKDEEVSTVCQCRYCDPCGEVWDVEQRCYSPFLTPPSPNEPKLFINSIRSVIGSLSKSHGSSYLLRRSWSEPSESSPITVRSRNKSDSYEPSSHDLQVSSEIITSPNGHRDIEIKFFSTPKRYTSDLHSVPYAPLTPPVSPWKKDVRFGDLFSLPNNLRPTVNVSP